MGSNENISGKTETIEDSPERYVFRYHRFWNRTVKYGLIGLISGYNALMGAIVVIFSTMSLGITVLGIWMATVCDVAFLLITPRWTEFTIDKKNHQTSQKVTNHLGITLTHDTIPSDQISTISFGHASVHYYERRYWTFSYFFLKSGKKIRLQVGHMDDKGSTEVIFRFRKQLHLP